MVRRIAALLGLTLIACGGAGEGGRLLVGATHTVDDSGLLPKILAAYDSTHPGDNVQTVVAGSGEILQFGRRGDLDVLITHSPRDEETFLADGFGADRQPVMWNEFVLLGPPDDPANARGFPDVLEALRRVVESGATFVSRGDLSGTHKRELELWDAARMRPASGSYIEAGGGMAIALRVASAQQAYILSDIATWTTLRPELELETVSRGGPRLLNVYSVMTVTGNRNPDAAQRFFAWLVSAEARSVIENHGVDGGGTPLFHGGAPPAARVR